MVCITLLCIQTIPILSAFFLCHPYIPLSNLKNFSFTCNYKNKSDNPVCSASDNEASMYDYDAVIIVWSWIRAGSIVWFT